MSKWQYDSGNDSWKKIDDEPNDLGVLLFLFVVLPLIAVFGIKQFIAIVIVYLNNISATV